MLLVILEALFKIHKTHTETVTCANPIKQDRNDNERQEIM